MDQTQVTLLAALIAAVVSIITLLGDLFSTWSGEVRATHRNALLPHLAELGSSIDNLINACINFNKQVERGNLNLSGLQPAFDAVAKLNEVRSKVKYPLWGIDIGIETITQLPNWVKDWINDSKTQQRLVQDSMLLKQLIDETIRRSYQVGHPPGRLHIWKIRSRSRQLENTWGHAQNQVSFKNI